MDNTKAATKRKKRSSPGRFFTRIIGTLEVDKRGSTSLLALLCGALPEPADREPGACANTDNSGNNNACDDNGAVGRVVRRGVVARSEGGEDVGGHFVHRSDCVGTSKEVKKDGGD